MSNSPPPKRRRTSTDEKSKPSTSKESKGSSSSKSTFQTISEIQQSSGEYEHDNDVISSSQTVSPARERNVGVRDDSLASTHVCHSNSAEESDNELAARKYDEGENDDTERESQPTSGLIPHALSTQDADPGLDDCYLITRIGSRNIKKFKSEAIDYKISFIDEKIRKYTEKNENVFVVVHDIFKRVIDTVIQEFESEDRIVIEIHAPGSLDRPIWVPLMRVSDMDVAKIQAAIERVQQSNQNIKLDGILEMHIIRIKVPTGNGVTDDEITKVYQFIKSKKSIIHIKSQTLCLARALVTARARIEKSKDWEKIRKGSKQQEILAKELHLSARVQEGPCSVQEIYTFQKSEVMKDYQIIVVPLENYKKRQFVYKGPTKDKKLYILYYHNHFDVITSMSGLLETSYFCEFCFKGFKTWEHHRCENICTGCFNSDKADCIPAKKVVECSDCGRTFQSKNCYSNHKKVPKALTHGITNKSVCERIGKCESCGHTKKDQHTCGERYCHSCKASKPKEHNCYMQILKSTQNTHGRETFGIDGLYIFFDFECRQEHDESGPADEPEVSTTTNSVSKHIPNFCVAQRVCGNCLDWVNDFGERDCKTCNKREEKIFEGEKTISEFCTWLLSDNNWGAIVIAHNMKGYDGHFVLSHLTKIGRCPEVLMNGSKIMSLEIKREKRRNQPLKTIKIIDSFNFIPMRLSDFPKTFEIDELQKGYFPHLFNLQENENYEGSWPDKRFYSHEEMKTAERTKFLQWYQDQEHKTFHFKKEICAYCKSDVDLLRRGCGRYRALFQELIKEDPFQSCITIASVAMRVYRVNFMKENTIALIKENASLANKRQSQIAIKWLRWMEEKDKCKIQHAKNNCEKTIRQYSVDGFCKESNKVYEFYGCYWHGCQKCYGKNVKGPGSAKTMGEVYNCTIARSNSIRKSGFDLEEIWECEYNDQLRKDIDMKSFIDKLQDPLDCKLQDPLDCPLDPRDAFYGGRTNATKLYHKVSGDDRIMYIDVCSLYPWVNKYGKYPIGHPDIIRHNLDEANLHTYEGLIKCTVIPPSDLYHPVLPYRCHGKLLFPLCRTCAEEKNSGTCDHGPEDRQLHGTWVTDEVKKAFKMGYKISGIEEVWHFDETRQYSSITGECGLFSEYVNTFLKVKQESDGWPSGCISEKDKEDYINDYEKREEIALNKDDIKKNPGKRTLAKLMLNSLWGKFGQRHNRTQTTFLNELDKLYEFIHAKSKIIETLIFTDNDETAEVHWRVADASVQTAPNTNVFIAAYTTAHARLKLYSYLEKLDRRVLYFDTDSIIYIRKKCDKYIPKTGRYLGDMTDELEKDYGKDSYIDEFVSAGPKNYAYRVITSTNTPQYVCKVKGFSLNHSTSKLINFDKIKDMVVAQCSSYETSTSSKTIKVPQVTIRRKKGDIVTKKGSKQYSWVYDKRILLKDLTTLPYGYKGSSEASE